MIDTRLEEMREQVQAFHDANPIVWELFNKFTWSRINAGFKRYGGQSIFERIRWETEAGEDGINHFKINNDYVAFYTRRWMRMNPEYDGFFPTREQKSAALDPVGRDPLTPADYGQIPVSDPNDY